MFDDRLTLEFDIDSIPALSERRKKIYENVTSAVREGIMTRNEARERIGLEPLEGGDGLYISANLFPLGDESVPVPNDPLNEEDLNEYLEDEEDEDPTNKELAELLVDEISSKETNGSVNAKAKTNSSEKI